MTHCGRSQRSNCPQLGVPWLALYRRRHLSWPSVEYLCLFVDLWCYLQKFPHNRYHILPVIYFLLLISPHHYPNQLFLARHYKFDPTGMTLPPVGIGTPQLRPWSLGFACQRRFSLSLLRRLSAYWVEASFQLGVSLIYLAQQRVLIQFWLEKVVAYLQASG